MDLPLCKERDAGTGFAEPNENPIETEGSAVRIPKDRLIVKDESVPAGLPSM